MHSLDCRNPVFNKEQIAKCKGCKHASAKIKWCGLHGIWIDKPEIIKPTRELTLPSKTQMAKNFTGSATKHIKSGMKQRSNKEQLKCRLICESNACGFYIEEKNRCVKCGCYLKAAIKWATKHCPIKKW